MIPLVKAPIADASTKFVLDLAIGFTMQNVRRK